MNRNQKIIVSITGIVLVTLILIGLTYAYFLTKITGNTNEKSISVTTANLELVYEDDTNEILTKENIQPGEEIGTKSFTVTNKGNTTISDYVVFLEDTNQILETKMTRPQDVKYTLTCTSSLGTACNGVTEGEFPSVDKILVHNTIKSKEVQTYVMTINYIDTGEDQSEDMNKLITGKLNIYDYKTLNPYNNSTDTLAYKIVNNALNGVNGLEYRNVPRTYLSTGATYEDIFEVEEKLDPYGDDFIVKDDTTDYTNSKFYYYDSYEAIDGKGYILKGQHVCNNYESCKTVMVGKYINSVSQVSSPVNKSQNVTQYIYKVKETNTDKIISQQISSNANKHIYENTLNVVEDDYGISYFYRGNGKTLEKSYTNFINFANMCWKIVRIEGDGSIKLFLVNQSGTCENTTTDDKVIGTASYGASNITINGTTIKAPDFYSEDASSMKNKLETWFASSSIKNNANLKEESWCIGNETSLYDSFSGEYIGEIQNMASLPTLISSENDYKLNINKDISSYKCSKNNTEYISKIGTLTLTEVMFSGSRFETNTPGSSLQGVNGTMIELGLYFDSLYYFESGAYQVYIPFMGYYVDVSEASHETNIIPSVVLKAGVNATGSGTLTDPYVVVE